MKIALERKPLVNRVGVEIAKAQITHALPFYQRQPGAYIHRVRSGFLHKGYGGRPHISLQFWCGNGGFLAHDRPNARLMADTPPQEVHCAVCEGKATGAGLNGAPVICGRPVKFSPRI